MRFCSLGSGSTGNATLVEASSGVTTTRVLIDCGFSLRELELRLARAGVAVEQLDAVFITHEHGDHVGCATALAQRHGVPLWMSHGTWRAIGEPDCMSAPGRGVPRPPPEGASNCLRSGRATVARARPPNFARDGQAIAIGNLELHPFTVPHDAMEPLQLRCSDGASSLGLLTDVGSITKHLLESLRGCDALLLECNHDEAMLAQSNYPASLKARIGGRLGHLANHSAAQILAHLQAPTLRHLVAAHLSERNNRPALAREALARVCGAAADDIVVADPILGFDWLALR